MSKFKFMKAMGLIEDRILERYMKIEKRLTATPRKNIWSRLTAIAACLVLVVAVVFISVLHLQNPTQKPQAQVYTAQDVDRCFDMHVTDFPTITVPNGTLPKLEQAPTDEFVSVFQDTHYYLPPDKDAFQNFIDGILPKLCNALGEQVPEYSITQRPIVGTYPEDFTYPPEYQPDPYNEHYLRSHTTFSSWRFTALQNASRHLFLLSGTNVDDQQQFITLDNRVLQIDLSQSDAEIASALEIAKDKLFTIFGVSFSDILIDRYGSSPTIYFYDADACVANRYAAQALLSPVSDFLKIRFEQADTSGETGTTSVWNAVSVQYVKTLLDIGQVYEQAQAKKVTIAQAESLLQNGYIWGGHSCPDCLNDPNRIRFEDYDLIGFEYRAFTTTTSLFAVPYYEALLPFYVFYKEIETTEDGITYAYAYVPAIEIEGVEEFFTAAQSSHIKN